MPDPPGPDVEGLQPVVGPVLLDHEHPLQSHQNVGLRLDVAVVEHGARLARGHLIRARFARPDGQLAGNRHTVVALPVRVHERMIHAVEMDGVRQVMRVFERHPQGVAGFDANDRGRRAQPDVRPVGLEIFRGHAARLGRKHPQPGLDAGRNGIGRKRRRIVGRATVQLDDFQPQVNVIRVAVAVRVVFLDQRIRRQPGLHERLRRNVVRPAHERRDFRGIVGRADRRGYDPHAVDRLFRTPLGMLVGTERLGCKRREIPTRRGRAIGCFPEQAEGRITHRTGQPRPREAVHCGEHEADDEQPTQQGATYPHGSPVRFSEAAGFCTRRFRTSVRHDYPSSRG